MSALAQHLLFAFASKKRGLSSPLDFPLKRDGDEGGDGGGEPVVAELEKEAEYEGTEEEDPIDLASSLSLSLDFGVMDREGELNSV